MLIPVTELRHPCRDQLAESPDTWEEIPLGVGQVPGATQPGDLQYNRQGDYMRGTDVQRTPGHDTSVVVHRPPEWPV